MMARHLIVALALARSLFAGFLQGDPAATPSPCPQRKLHLIVRIHSLITIPPADLKNGIIDAANFLRRSCETEKSRQPSCALPACDWEIRVDDVQKGGWPEWRTPILADALNNGTHGTVAMQELFRHALTSISHEAARLKIPSSAVDHLATLYLVPVLEGDCKNAGPQLTAAQRMGPILLGCALRGNNGGFGQAAIIKFPRTLPRNPKIWKEQLLVVSHELAHLLGLRDLSLRYRLSHTVGSQTTTRVEEIRLHKDALMGVPFSPSAVAVFPQECRYLLSGKHELADGCGYQPFVNSLIQMRKKALTKVLGQDAQFLE